MASKPWENYSSGNISSSGASSGPWSKYGGGKSAVPDSGSSGANSPVSVANSGAVAAPALGLHPPDPTHMAPKAALFGMPDQRETPAAKPGPGTASAFAPGIDIASGMINQLRGGMQRSSPNTSQYGKAIGEVHYDDAGLPVVDTGPKTMRRVNDNEVILLDPDTGKEMVYQRNKNTERGTLASAGNIIAPGTLTTAPEGALGPAVSKHAGDVNTLLDKGITPTIGQMKGGIVNAMEQKLASFPFLGDLISKARVRSVDDLNTAAYNDVLAPLGQTVKSQPGREAVAETEKRISDGYDALMPKLMMKPDPQLVTDLKQIQQSAHNVLPEAQANTYDKIMKGQIGDRWKQAGPSFALHGDTFKGVESELSKEIRGYRGSQSWDDRKLANALEDTLTALRGNLSRSNPSYAPDLQKLNSAWAKYVRLRRAASAVGAEDGVFTPNQLQSSVRATDKSVDKGKFAKGQALMQDLSDPAKNVLGGKVPDSGTAGRLLSSNPLSMAAGLGLSVPGLIPYSKFGQQLMARVLRPNMAGSPSTNGTAILSLLRQMLPPQSPPQRNGQ